MGLDVDGNPATDANVALNGSMAPIGGPKGSGIAIIMDIMSGARSGAAFTDEVGDQYKDSPAWLYVYLTQQYDPPSILLSTQSLTERMDRIEIGLNDTSRLHTAADPTHSARVPRTSLVAGLSDSVKPPPYD
ncbi:uncharacterized protein N7473_012388 [Penicillium subrubescens]|uniref:uncharacterized protein n=1 Tax=Penicillium subrubescens TaxID=1316194 RepID=UPI002545659F|nr:uncharacterized protein N7473_012388 [Penicillium subrubescens]KAJ5875041.1 hypothetical protein N7473_012388 [Penicillium subrubescens]